MTGRALGYCAGYTGQGHVRPAAGLGFGRGLGLGLRRGFGRGFGRGRAWGYGVGFETPYPAPASEQELDVLKAEAENLGNVLEGIQARIGELEKGDNT